VNVKLRLQRFGSKKRAYYRIVAAPNVKKRDGRFLEIIGLYHPLAGNEKVRLRNERIMHWLNEGAQPTDTVRDILSNAGIWKEFTDAKLARRKARRNASTASVANS